MKKVRDARFLKKEREFGIRTLPLSRPSFSDHLYCKIFFKLCKYMLWRDKVWNISWTCWQLAFCIITPGPAVWFTVEIYAASYYGCHIYLCPVSPEIAVAFLVESYKRLLERRAYVSCINFIKLFYPCAWCLGLSLQFIRSCAANVDVHAQVCRLFCVLYDIVGFCSGKVLSSTLEIRSFSSDCSSSSMLWSSLLLFAMF